MSVLPLHGSHPSLRALHDARVAFAETAHRTEERLESPAVEPRLLIASSVVGVVALLAGVFGLSLL